MQDESARCFKLVLVSPLLWHSNGDTNPNLKLYIVIMISEGVGVLSNDVLQRISQSAHLPAAIRVHFHAAKGS